MNIKDNFRYPNSIDNEYKQSHCGLFFNLSKNSKKVEPSLKKSFIQTSESIDALFEIINQLDEQYIPQVLINQLAFLFQHVRFPLHVFKNAHCALFMDDEDRKIEIGLLSNQIGHHTVSMYFDDDKSNEYTSFLRYTANGKLKIMNGSILDIAHHLNYLYEEN